MCPNCFPSLGISPGYVVAFFVCILFFGVGLVTMIIANRSGHMDGLEETKYTMLED